MSPESPTSTQNQTEDWIRERISHALSIYPKLSPSMLQVGIGTALAPKIWKPVLETMIKEGVVIKEELSAKTPGNRDLEYTILSLAPSTNK